MEYTENTERGNRLEFLFRLCKLLVLMGSWN